MSDDPIQINPSLPMVKIRLQTKQKTHKKTHKKKQQISKTECNYDEPTFG